MKILKVLNNNAVVFKEGGVEKIAMGPGIAFQKGKNDLINAAKVEKVFVMKEEQEKFQELLKTFLKSIFKWRKKSFLMLNSSFLLH